MRKVLVLTKQFVRFDLSIERIVGPSVETTQTASLPLKFELNQRK